MPQYLVVDQDQRVVGEFEAVNPETAVNMSGVEAEEYVTIYSLGTDPYGNVQKVYGDELDPDMMETVETQ